MFVLVLPLASKSTTDDLSYRSTLLSAKISGRCLQSLVKAFSLKSFGFDSVNRFSYKLDTVDLDDYVELYIDSGGYSIIVGDISLDEIVKLTECYSYYLLHQSDKYDYIFSLDIPMSLKYKECNTKKNIYEFNKHSLETTLNIIENNNPKLWDKLIFVWHFKIKELYDIWKSVYEELNLKQYVKNYAIAGIASTRSVVDLKFAPFITMMYKLLLDVRDKKYLRLHALGVRVDSDRFILFLLSHLFTKYYNVRVELTYDTVSPIYRIFDLRNRYITFYYDKKLYNVYGDGSTKLDPKLVDYFERNFEAFDPGITPKLIDALMSQKREVPFVTLLPFTTLSQTSIDDFFCEIIETTDILEKIISIKSWDALSSCITSYMLSLQRLYPDVIYDAFISQTIENFKFIFTLNNLYMSGELEKRIDEMMYRTIEKIGFPMRFA